MLGSCEVGWMDINRWLGLGKGRFVLMDVIFSTIAHGIK
jgi:hypothetical protein